MALPFKIIITVAYFLLLLWISLNIFIIWRGGHKVKSFEFAFFVMCLLWSILRSVFWFSTLGLYNLSDEGEWTLLVSLWLPTPLQCVAGAPHAPGCSPSPRQWRPPTPLIAAPCAQV